MDTPAIQIKIEHRHLENETYKQERDAFWAPFFLRGKPTDNKTIPVNRPDTDSPSTLETLVESKFGLNLQDLAFQHIVHQLVRDAPEDAPDRFSDLIGMLRLLITGEEDRYPSMRQHNHRPGRAPAVLDKVSTDELRNLIELAKKEAQHYYGPDGENPLFAEISRRVIELTAIQWAARISGYSSLVLELRIHPVARVSRFFDHDIASLETFLLARSPEAFEKTLPTKYRAGCTDLRFDVEISAGYSEAFAAVQSAALSSPVGAPSSQ